MMQTQSGPSLDIVFCSDRGYSLLVLNAVLQLNRMHRNKFRIHYLLVETIDSKIEKKLKACGVNIVYVNPEIITKFHSSHHITLATYLRIYVGAILALNKFIYLDPDIILTKKLSLQDFYSFEKSGYVLAAVPGYERWGDDLNRLNKSSIQFSILFNAGIMFFNFENYPVEKFIEQNEKIYEEFRPYILWWDQDILNFFGNEYGFYKLDFLTWNYIPLFDELKPGENPCIIHYAGEFKPWKHFNLSKWNVLFWKSVILNCLWKEFHFLYYFKRFLIRILTFQGGIKSYH